MTSPLVTVDPEATITDAARRMSKQDIRRLGVLYKGKLVGIVSSKDILDVMPELLEIMQERTRIEGAGDATEEAEEAPLSGYCDRCGIHRKPQGTQRAKHLRRLPHRSGRRKISIATCYVFKPTVTRVFSSKTSLIAKLTAIHLERDPP